jgi:hypothetical protein
LPDETALPPAPADVIAVLTAYADGITPERSLERTAVKVALAELVTRAPGRSVEVRIPPHAAVQVIEGVRHTRGTPAAVVEADARTWLALAVGDLEWSVALASGRLRASGERSDLAHLLPLFVRVSNG